MNTEHHPAYWLDRKVAERCGVSRLGPNPRPCSNRTCWYRDVELLQHFEPQRLARMWPVRSTLLALPSEPTIRIAPSLLTLEDAVAQCAREHPQ
jgi:hypothetical protein